MVHWPQKNRFIIYYILLCVKSAASIKRLIACSDTHDMFVLVHMHTYNTNR